METLIVFLTETNRIEHAEVMTLSDNFLCIKLNVPRRKNISKTNLFSTEISILY